MPVIIERLPEEAIIRVTVTRPFEPQHDVPAMFAKFIPLRMAIQGPVVLIVDLSATSAGPDAFSQMVVALAEAGRGIKAGKQAGVGGPPMVIMVGAGVVADIAAQSLDQEQYGGTRADLCATYEEALALARTKLAG